MYNLTDGLVASSELSPSIGSNREDWEGGGAD